MKLLSLALLLMAGLAFVLLGCSDSPESPVASTGDPPQLNKAPADGNGNKQVFEWDVTQPIDCGGSTITLHVVGWAQVRVFGQPNNRNVEIDIFHNVLTYSNAVGDTWMWRDLGPDHYYVQDGQLFITITGTSTASGNINRDEIVVGHVVLNLTTGETVFVAGRELGSVHAMACDALN